MALLSDRICLPLIGGIYRRTRLINLLKSYIIGENPKRLITAYAPGGYGKTVLLADLAQEEDLPPVCWCSLEAADRDPTSLLTLLAHSIIDRFHDLDTQNFLQIIERGDRQASIHRIADVLAKAGRHVIIFDDYHKATSAGVTLALNGLLQQLPPESTLIIAGRGDMYFDVDAITDLLLTGLATGLSEEHLSFTGPEIKQVMRKRFGRYISSEKAEAIAAATDGNIAQILLTGHARHAGLVERLGQDKGTIYKHLAEEVLEKQPIELQQFMLHTSILPYMTPALCNGLPEISNAQQHLEILVQTDLFINRTGGRFRYHDLFAKFLRDKLAENPTEHRRVALGIAELMSKHGKYKDAINLYLEVQAWDRAAKLLEAHETGFYDTGRALTLYDWLKQIDEEEVARWPRLLLLKGKILNNNFSRHSEAMKFFDDARRIFAQRDDLIGMAEAQIWQSVSFRMTGQVLPALETAKQGLETLEELRVEGRVLAWATRIQGMAYSKAGKTKRALEDKRRALQLFEALGDKHLSGLCHHDIGVDLVTQGNISGADYHYKQALHIWESLADSNNMANTFNSLGVSCYLTGRHEEALKYFRECLKLTQIEGTRWATFAYAGLGDVHLAGGEYKNAIEAYRTSTELAQQTSVQSLEVYNMVKLAECCYQQNDLKQALQLANQSRQLASETKTPLEWGLACTLLGKIYVRQGKYTTSFELFAEALDHFKSSDVLEQVKVRLWWGYGLFLDFRPLAALNQLEKAIELTLPMVELLPSLRETATGIKQLLWHYRHKFDAAKMIQAGIQLLLDISRPEKDWSLDLQIFAFGEPYLIINDKRYVFTQTGRAVTRTPELLLYMVVEGQDGGCTSRRISAAIWPDAEPDKASVSFHHIIKRLRNDIFKDPASIIEMDNYYRLNPRFLWCDVLAFETLFKRAANMPPEQALSLWLEIINLYRGEFLAGFELDEWGTGYRGMLAYQFSQIVEQAAKQLLRNGVMNHPVFQIFKQEFGEMPTALLE